MKGILGLVVLLAIGVGAYFVMNSGEETPETTATSDASETESDDATTETTTEEASEATEDAVESVEDAAEALQDEAEAAVEELKDEAEAAVEDAKEELEEAADAIENSVNDAVNNLTGNGNTLLDDTADAGSDAVEGTTNRIQGALENALGNDNAADVTVDDEVSQEEANANLEHDAPAADSMEVLSQALTVEGFDGLAIRQAIQGSELNDLNKAALEALVTSAEENPDQIQSVVGQLREALGL